MSTTIQDILDKENENNSAEQPGATQNSNPSATAQVSAQNAIAPQVENKPDVPKDINNPIPAVTPQITTDSKGNPLNQIKPVSNEDMERVRQGANLIDILKAYAPKAPDENQLRRNRMLGSIGDGIKLLGQMYGAGKGAYIRNNNPNESLTNYFLNEEKQIRDLYQKQKDEYDRMNLSTAIQEYNRKMNQENQMALLDARQKYEDQQTQQKQAYQSAESQKKIDSNERIAAATEIGRNARADNSLKEQKNYHNTRNAIEAERVNNAKEKVNDNDDQLLYDAVRDSNFMKTIPDEMFYYKYDNTTGERIEDSKRISNPKYIVSMYKRYLQNTPSVQQDTQQQGSNQPTQYTWYPHLWYPQYQNQQQEIPKNYVELLEESGSQKTKTPNFFK